MRWILKLGDCRHLLERRCFDVRLLDELKKVRAVERSMTMAWADRHLFLRAERAI